MRRPNHHLLKSGGFTLIDAMIGLAILAFGLLGMTRLQTRVLAQANESGSRITAVQYGDELISSALIDAVNFGCYELPAVDACGSTTASAITTDWNTRLQAALPGGTATSVYTAATGQLAVTIHWTGKESTEAHQLVATTDVRQ